MNIIDFMLRTPGIYAIFATLAVVYFLLEYRHISNLRMFIEIQDSILMDNSKRVLFIDFRKIRDFLEGSIINSVHYNPQKIETYIKIFRRGNKPLVLYGNTLTKMKDFYRKIKQHGEGQIFILKGNVDEWQRFKLYEKKFYK